MVQRSMHYVASSYAPRLRQRLATGSIVREIAEKGDRLCTSAAPERRFDVCNGMLVSTHRDLSCFCGFDFFRLSFLSLYCEHPELYVTLDKATRIENDDERLSAVPVWNQQSSPNLRTLAFSKPADSPYQDASEAISFSPALDHLQASD